MNQILNSNKEDFGPPFFLSHRCSCSSASAGRRNGNLLARSRKPAPAMQRRATAAKTQPQLGKLYPAAKTQLWFDKSVPRPLKPSSDLAMQGCICRQINTRQLLAVYLLLLSVVEHHEYLCYILVELRFFIARRSVLFIIIKQVSYEFVPAMPYIVRH